MASISDLLLDLKVFPGVLDIYTRILMGTASLEELPEARRQNEVGSWTDEQFLWPPFMELYRKDSEVREKTLEYIEGMGIGNLEANDILRNTHKLPSAYLGTEKSAELNHMMFNELKKYLDVSRTTRKSPSP